MAKTDFAITPEEDAKLRFQGTPTPSPMDETDLKLSEAQYRYFGDLFLLCLANSTAVSYEKATDLFASANNISPDVIRQVN